MSLESLETKISALESEKIDHSPSSVQWEPILGYEDLYYISYHGWIKNNKGTLLRPKKQPSGLYRVSLSKDGKKTSKNVHSLLAETFVHNPYPDTTAVKAGFKDGDRDNLSTDNLEWQPLGEPIVNVETGEIFNSIIEAAANYGISMHKLKGYISGKTKENPTPLDYLDESRRATKRGAPGFKVEIKTFFKNNLEQYAYWIELSKSSLLRADSQKIIRPVKAIDLAYFVANNLVDGMPIPVVAVNIGRQVIQSTGIEYKSSDDRSISAYKLGYDLLAVLFERDKIRLTDVREEEMIKGKKKQIKVKFVDKKFVYEMIGVADNLPDPPPIYSRVTFERPWPFVNFNHPVAGELVRNANRKVRRLVEFDKTNKVFSAINDQMDVAYNLNIPLLNIIDKCIEDEDDLLCYTDKNLKNKALEGKLRERDRIISIARGIGNRKFWCYMYYDYRNRMYFSTAYLNFGASKLAKSLFLIDEKKVIGTEGLSWMHIHAANCWGFDKESLNGRHDFSNDNISEWIKWAKEPHKYKGKKDEGGNIIEEGWQVADDPFLFLASIMELNNAYSLKDPTKYESGLPISFDATCSGLQVLSALSKDVASAIMCNLTNSEKRGDYYLTIADMVWEDCKFTKKEEKQFNKLLGDDFFTHYMEATGSLRNDIKTAKTKEDKEKAVLELKVYKEEQTPTIYMLSKVFWGMSNIMNKRRGIVKRSAMTYFYSCKQIGMSDHIIEDFESEKGFEELNLFIANWLAKKIYKACRDTMKGPTQLMDLFIKMGVEAYGRGEHLHVTAPYTEFPMIQHYYKSKDVRVQSSYKGRRIASILKLKDVTKLSKTKIKNGSAPNITHMFDSQLVSHVILNTDYEVLTIHDSFSCVPAMAGDLFEQIRKSFVILFNGDVLLNFLIDNGYGHLYEGLDIGDLDVTKVLDDEYCFS